MKATAHLSRTPKQPAQVTLPMDAFAYPPAAKAGAPRVADLFAGAGGFGLGFRLAGFRVQSAIEIDSWACDTMKHNDPDCRVLQADLNLVSDKRLLEHCRDADVLVGGPPCQGFSVANIRAGDPSDPRNSLFQQFVRAARLSRPRVVVLENVPGLLKRKTHSGEPVIDVIKGELEAIGYKAYHTILQAVEFGVPQLRPRLFVLGYRREVKQPFPAPTHHGSAASENVPSLFTTSLLPALSLWDAISDLPEVEAREGAEEMAYDKGPASEYEEFIRAGSKLVFNHLAMRHSERLVQRFSMLKCGESSADAPAEHAARKRGEPDELSGKTYDQNNRRMFPDRPCHTVPASFYANFIHPFKHRNFTPREGARIQSFPDWYRFLGKPTVVSQKLLEREGRIEEKHLCQYNQIGNAVPPLLAYHLAKHVLKYL